MLKKLRAGVGNERVHQQHVGAELDQPAGDVAADEAEAAGDHHAPAAVEVLIAGCVTARASCSARRRRCRLGAGARCVRRTTSANQSFSTSMAVRYDAREVEELRLPVRAVVVVHRHLDDREAGVLDLLHHLQADDAAVLLEPHAVEDRPAQHPEVAVDVAHAQAEQHLDDVVIEAADDDAVPADPSG